MSATAPSIAQVSTAFRVFVWPRRGLLALGLGLIFVNRLCGLVLPGATKYLLDDVIVARDAALLPQLVTAVAVAVSLQAVTGFALTQLLSVEAQRLIAELRAQVQRHVIRLPVSYFDSTKSGALVSRIMRDVEGVRNLVGTGVVQLVGGGLTAMICFVILLNLDPKLTAVALVPLVIFGVISMKAFAIIRPIFRKRAEVNAEVTGRLTESLGG
ncbi:MAG: ABC transporter ATP-binding protein, partial [Planctomycetota bacterium]